MSRNSVVSPTAMPVLDPLPAWPAPTISTISQWEEEEETDGEWYQQINRALATADTGSVQVPMDFSDQTQKTSIELVSPYCGATEPLDEANVDTWQHDISGIPGQLYPDEATEMEVPIPPVPKPNQVGEARGESLVKKNPIPVPGPMLAFP